jgi:hypothetical protein
MDPSELPDVGRIAFRHAALGTSMLFLDQLVARMVSRAVSLSPRPGDEWLRMLSRFPAELVLLVLGHLSIFDLFQF